MTCEDSESAIWKVSGVMVWDSRKNLWLSMAWLGRREGVCGVEGCLWGGELTRPLAANRREEVQDYLRLHITVSEESLVHRDVETRTKIRPCDDVVFKETMKNGRDVPVVNWRVQV